MKFGSWAFLVVLLPGIAFAALTNTERKSQFEKAFASIMAAATPQVSTPIRDRLVRDYLDMPLNKAQAVQLADGNYFRASLHEDPSVVGDRTLEACQLRYAKPCALLAINDEIVAEGELISKDMPRLHYAGKYDISQIPIIRLVTKKRPDVQFYDRAWNQKRWLYILGANCLSRQGTPRRRKPKRLRSQNAIMTRRETEKMVDVFCTPLITMWFLPSEECLRSEIANRSSYRSIRSRH